MRCRQIVWQSRPLSNRLSSSSVAGTTAGTITAGMVRASTGAAMRCGVALAGAAEPVGAAGIMAWDGRASDALAVLECGRAALGCVPVDVRAAVGQVVVMEAALTATFNTAI